MTTGSRFLRVGALPLALLLVLCFSAVAHADTFDVNDNSDANNVTNCQSHTGGCTLRGAIGAANTDGSDSTINVPADRYDRALDSSQYVVETDGALTINGTTGDPKDVIISADGIDRVLAQDPNTDLTLSNVTVQDGFTGNTNCNGGGVYVSSGDGGTTRLTVDNSRVIKNVDACYDDGGGIWAGTDTSVTLNGSHVDNNNTLGQGGGIAYEGDLTVTNSTVNGNTTTEGAGGGIANNGTSLTVSGSEISGNVAGDDDGGGIYNGNSDANLTDTHVDNNVSYAYGGGIYSGSGSLSLTRVTVNSNKGWGYGGGVYQDSDGLNAVDTQIDNNWAQVGGGGVYNGTGPASFKDGSVSGNKAQGVIGLFCCGQDGEGGGIYNDGSDEETGAGLTVDGTDVSNNVANAYNGGGIANDSGDLSVKNATVNSNKTGSLSLCLIFSYECIDASTRGGGIYNDGGDADVADSQVNDNFAEEQGGGIYNDGGDLTVEGTSVDRNQAKNSQQNYFAYTDGGGGGIYNTSETSLTVTDSHVDDNRATSDSGGGIWHDGFELTVTRTSVDGNFADIDGGGVWDGGAVQSIVDSSISKNIAYENGAGLYLNRQSEVIPAARSHGITPSSKIQNSTIANNQADVDNGGNKGGGIYNTAQGLTLTNVTLAGNLVDSGDGGGIFTTNDVGLVNTIVADNQANGTDPSNCGGDVSLYTSNGDNLENKGNQDPSGTDCNLVDGTNGDQVVTDPRLGPLQDNGGPTLTRALLDGSAAIDSGNDGVCNDPVGNHDQRQAVRPVGDHCDVGAYEAYALGDLAITKDGPASVNTGGNVTYTLHVSNNGPDKIQSVTVQDALPAGVTFVSATPSQGTCSGTTTVTCNLGAMDSGATATVTIVVTAPGSATTLTNTASVGGAPSDPDSSNNSSSLQTQVVSPSGPAANVVPGPNVQGGPKSCETTPPRTSISRNGLFVAANTLRFVGRSIDLRCLTSSSLGIAQVQVAVGYVVGSNAAAAKKCRFLTKKGTLGKARSCNKPQFLKARRGKIRNGKVPWTFRMRKLHLPKGSYVVIARGIDTKNHIEKKLRKYNRKTFRIH